MRLLHVQEVLPCKNHQLRHARRRQPQPDTSSILCGGEKGQASSVEGDEAGEDGCRAELVAANVARHQSFGDLATEKYCKRLVVAVGVVAVRKGGSGGGSTGAAVDGDKRNAAVVLQRQAAVVAERAA